MEEQKISEIRYPNNVTGDNQNIFRLKDANNNIVVDDIKRIYKNGEMAEICWFQIIKHGIVVAEIKESVCDIYF